MKRKSNYNIRHKKGGKSYKDIPDQKPNKRLRPVASTDPGASIVDDPAKITLYTVGVLALCYGIQLIQKFVL